MKYFVISDNTDTLVGLRLAGIPGVRAETREGALSAIDAAAADPEVGILLITEALAALCRDKLDPMKLSAQTPLVVEIPDRHGSRSKDSITRYIQEAIGVKM